MQREQKRRLEAVASSDRIHHLDRWRCDLNESSLLVPGLDSFRSACDHEKAAAASKLRFRFGRVRLVPAEVSEIDVRHANDIGAVGERTHSIEIVRFVLEFFSVLLKIMLESEGDRITVLDVREPGEVATAAIDHSVRIPLAQLQSRVDELGRDKLLVVHCKGGYRSSIATSILRRAGFRDIANLTGGFDAWQALRQVQAGSGAETLH